MVTRSPHSSIERRITFFVNQPKHEEAVAPIAEAARNRGYEVTYTGDLAADAEIGVYLDHVHKINSVNATLSVVMLHSIDDAYKPDHWLDEPWYRFDVGLLHGNPAVENWISQSWHPKTRPKLGAFCVGWPKFDPVFSPGSGPDADALKSQLGIDDGLTAIYAPYGEDDDKLASFVAEARGTVPNLLIRHAPRDEVDYTRPFYEEILADDRVYVLDDTWEFIECLRISDVLVSDGSSVIQEAVLTDTVPISVTEWRKPAVDEVLPEYCFETSRNELAALLENICDDLSAYRRTLQEHRDNHFANLGSSSETVVDLLDAFVDGREPPIDPIPHETTAIRRVYSRLIGMPYQRFRDRVVFSMSNDTKARLRRWQLDRPLNYLDRITSGK